MSTWSDQAVPRGDVMRRLEELERAVARLRTARRLEAASVGEGGLRIHSGGDLRLEGGGTLSVADGGTLGVLTPDGSEWSFSATPNGLFLAGGSGLHVLDGGAISARYSGGGGTALLFGSLIWDATGEAAGHGLLVQDDADADHRDIFRAVRRPDGDTEVIVGQTDAMTGDSEPIDLLSVRAQEVRLRGYGSATSWLEVWGAGADVGLYSDSGNVTLIANVGAVQTTYVDTGESANARLAEDGTIQRVSSRRALKADIADLDGEPRRVLDLRPRTWLPAEQTTAAGPGAEGRQAQSRPAREPQQRQFGLVAEEVDEVAPELVTRAADGAPDGVRYDRVAVALLPLLRRQQQQIDDLTQRLGALEAAVSP